MFVRYGIFWLFLATGYCTLMRENVVVQETGYNPYMISNNSMSNSNDTSGGINPYMYGSNRGHARGATNRVYPYNDDSSVPIYIPERMNTKNENRSPNNLRVVENNRKPTQPTRYMGSHQNGRYQGNLQPQRNQPQRNQPQRNQPVRNQPLRNPVVEVRPNRPLAESSSIKNSLPMQRERLHQGNSAVMQMNDRKMVSDHRMPQQRVMAASPSNVRLGQPMSGHLHKPSRK